MSETINRRQRIDRWVIGIVIAVFVLIAFIGCAVGSANAGRDTNNADEAIAQCEARIERLLKAPATAKFDSEATGSNTWTVTGTVDAENSFGANVRSAYQCTVVIKDDKATTTVDYLE